MDQIKNNIGMQTATSETVTYNMVFFFPDIPRTISASVHKMITTHITMGGTSHP
jgi:hypothetical protein